MGKTILSQLLRILLICALLLVGGYFFFVQTRIGQSIDNAAYFGHDAVHRAVLAWDGKILSTVTPHTLIFAAIVVMVLSILRRRISTGVLLVAAMAVAVEGAELLKRYLPREQLVDPAGPVPPYFRTDTYPSGHTTFGTSIALALLLVLPAAWRPWFAVVAAGGSAAYAVGVLFAGWHRPSDSIGGILWAALCMGSAAAVILWIRKSRAVPRSPHPAAKALPFTVGTAALLAVLWSASLSGGRFPDADAPFFIASALIVGTAFAVGGSFGWLLGGADEL